jgi:hypothetical protein
MEAYMNQTENKLNIDQLLGNISKNDLIPNYALAK